MDLCDHTAAVFKGELLGFYVMFTLLSSFYIASYTFLKYYYTGNMVELEFLMDMGHDLSFVLTSWPLLTLWSMSAVILQKLILKGLP